MTMVKALIPLIIIGGVALAAPPSDCDKLRQENQKLKQELEHDKVYENQLNMALAIQGRMLEEAQNKLKEEEIR